MTRSPFAREPRGYTGGTRVAQLRPRTAVQRPSLVGPSERFVVRTDDGARLYGPAVPTVVLPVGAHWTFEPKPGALRIGLHCPPTTTAPAGFVGLLHESGDLFTDRLRARSWVPEHALGRSFRAVRAGALLTTPALTGERFVEPRGLVWLRAADVLTAEGGSEPPARWFTVEWPEPDMGEAARELQLRARTNGTLLTDRLAETVSSELLAPDAHGRFTIPTSDDLPPEQGVTVLAVNRHGQRLRGADQLGGWDAAVFRVEPLARFPGVLARLHCPDTVTSALIELVRYPTARPTESNAPGTVAESVADDGLLAATEFYGPLHDLTPARHELHRDESLRQVLAEYPRYDLRRLVFGAPECGDVVFWPSARGLQAVLPTVLRIRPEPRLSARDLVDLVADLDEYLAHYMSGPFHHRCRVEEERHAP